MPNAPKWVVDQLESLLPSKFLNIEVTSVLQYGPKVKGVAFRGNLSGISFFPGSAVNFRVSATEIRHYTPSAFNRETGIFEILFHIHGNGPGSALADRLQPGDRLKVSVPGGRKIFDKDRQEHFFFGDETSLSFYMVAMNEIRRKGQTATAIFELDEEQMQLAEKPEFGIYAVRKSPEAPGNETCRIMETLMAQYPGRWEQAIFYLTGNAASAQQFRSMLKKQGISSKNIKLQGYWTEGKTGL